MAEKKFIIEVRSKGFAKATRDFDKLDTSTRSYNKTADRMRGSTSGLIANIGSLRNKILVYSFALGGAATAINKFIGASVQFENARVRLEGLTGSAELASQAFDNFRGVASRTPFQLADVVNAGITLESFGVNANDTLESLVDLAAFMQTTATEAASALGRAYAGGAGAADILRERGILQIIKDSRGIQDLTKITLPEFRQALISAMADPDGRISGSADRLSETFSGAVSNMQDSINEFAATIGDLVLDDMKALVNSIEDFFRAIDIKRIKEFTTSLAVFSSFLVAGKVWLFVKSLDAFAVSLIGVNFAAKISVLLAGRFVKILGLMAGLFATDFIVKQLSLFEKFSENVDGATTSTENFNKEIDNYNYKSANIIKTTENFSKSVEDVEKALNNQRDALVLQIAELEGKSTKDLALIQTGDKLTGTISDTSREIDILNGRLKDLKGQEEFKQATNSSINSLKSERDAIRAKIAELNGTDLVGQRLITTNKLLTTEEENLIKEIEDLTQKLQNQKDAQEALNNAKKKSLEKDNTFLSLLGQTTEGQKANIQSTIEMVEANRKQFEVLGNVDSVLALLNNDLDNVKGSNEKLGITANQTAQYILLMASSLKSLTEAGATSEQKFKSLINTLGQLLMLMPSPEAKSGGAILQAFSMLIGHTGGLIKNNGIQRFATGGQVQGQDNVPIMAQAGEFIMRREAVQNIGVNNLANMNRSGSAGSNVTVNISGGLIDDGYINNQLIPAINEATSTGNKLNA